MTTDLTRATADYAVRLGDDALILGHRLSEWCSNGPFLEEDLALTNVALDYIGRARMFLGYGAQLIGGDCTEDTLAYQRDCREFTNLLINELPRGDFAFTMARQYLLDEHALLFLEALQGSSDAELAAIATKAIKETRYHLRRSREWMLRLGDGTEESRRRLQQALEDIWGYLPELFAMDELERELLAAGIAVDREALEAPWRRAVSATFAETDVTLPADGWRVDGGRTGYHTEHLGHLLSELQFVQRAYPGCQW
ncbi:1,2-phenylacetyl-CoA epoxidase subunit PaaC [Parahaliea mediterranea]|uniref:Phenylacetate-CoA oxygenase subunit PaaC n=1 Tax=Parahaliea mediterranea TaxID=651086 RepID=A0A939IMT2_9GAMM|nr:1,2-phenylacetyl-CoA epoxidase subunit PaaC [Parahaliea mediterranea]MBN7797358.1 phenylacetate-CoA oxygenase subunit PaaC [Parahaliea mediterranea]